MLTFSLDIFNDPKYRKKRRAIHNVITRALQYKDGTEFSSEIWQRDIGNGYRGVTRMFLKCTSPYEKGQKCNTFVLRDDVEIINVRTKEERQIHNKAKFITFDPRVDQFLKNSRLRNDSTTCLLSRRQKQPQSWRTSRSPLTRTSTDGRPTCSDCSHRKFVPVSESMASRLKNSILNHLSHASYTIY